MLTLSWIGRPLRTPPVYLPFGLTDGIVAFELAGDPQTAREIVDRWQGDLLLRAGFSLGLDYLFIVAYATALALACLWAVDQLRSRVAWLASLGIWLAWGQWLAGALDAVENGALVRQLLIAPSSPWAEIAYWSATFKFLLIFAGGAYLFLGCLCFAVLSVRARTRAH
jgi:hypothetical protein